MGASLFPRQILSGEIVLCMVCKGAYIQCVKLENVGMRIGRADYLLVVRGL